MAADVGRGFALDATPSAAVLALATVGMMVELLDAELLDLHGGGVSSTASSGAGSSVIIPWRFSMLYASVIFGSEGSVFVHENMSLKKRQING